MSAGDVPGAAARGRTLTRTRVYCHQAAHGGPHAQAVVGLLWREHAAGVTVLAASEGFGRHRVHVHGAHHPVVVEWLDTPETVARIWPRLAPLLAGGLVTRDTVTVLDAG